MPAAEPLRLDYDIEQNWADFTANVWDQQPAVLGQVPEDLRMDSGELFDTVVAATSGQGPGLSPTAKFYIGQAAQILDIDRYLPRKSDGGLKNYFDRVTELVGGKPFLLVLNHLNVHNPRLWTGSARFLSGLYRSTGKVPFGQVDIDVFLGEYPCTPFGVHADGAANFMTVPYGTKRMIIWPDDHPAPMGTLDYERSRPDGVWLDCDETQMAYWPGFHRHVGEARDGPSVSVNLALYMETRYLDDLFAMLERELTTRFPELCSGGMYPVSDEAPAVMPELMAGIRAALPGIAGSAQFVTQVQRHWLEKYTGYGFLRIAPLPDASPVLETGTRLLAHEHSRIVWDAVHHVLAANGHSRVVSAALDVGSIVRVVTGRSAKTFFDIAVAAGIEPEPAALRQLRSVLQFLIQCDAIAVLS